MTFSNIVKHFVTCLHHDTMGATFSMHTVSERYGIHVSKTQGRIPHIHTHVSKRVIKDTPTGRIESQYSMVHEPVD